MSGLLGLNKDCDETRFWITIVLANVGGFKMGYYKGFSFNKWTANSCHYCVTWKMNEALTMYSKTMFKNAKKREQE